MVDPLASANTPSLGRASGVCDTARVGVYSRALEQPNARLPAVADPGDRRPEQVRVGVGEECLDHPRLGDVVLARALGSEGAGS